MSNLNIDDLNLKDDLEKKQEVLKSLKEKNLIGEIEINRVGLNELIEEIKKYKTQISGLFPSKIDQRNKFVIEQRVGLLMELLKCELQVRQTIDNSIRGEVQVQEKIKRNDETSDDNMSSNDNVRQLASLVEEQLLKNG